MGKRLRYPHRLQTYISTDQWKHLVDRSIVEDKSLAAIVRGLVQESLIKSVVRDELQAARAARVKELTHVTDD